MRIAMVHSSFAIRGGAERYVRDLTRSLVDRGHQVAVFCREPACADPADRQADARLTDRLTRRFGERLDRVPGLPKILTHLGDLFDPTGISPGDLRAFAPDVVHVHNWQGLGVLAVARLSRAYPSCHSVHDYAIRDPNNALGNLGRARAVDAVLAIRTAWINLWLRRTPLLFSTERVRTVVRGGTRGPAGAAADRVVPLGVITADQRGPWPAGHRDTFLFLGRLSRHKGVDLLLRAWEKSYPEIGGTLLIGGDGPLRAEVEQAANAQPSVRYLGYLDEAGKRSALRRAGWLVFPSQWPETFGIVCAEALIAGRPVISSAIAAPPMTSDDSSLVFSSTDQLAARLAQAAHMPDDQYRAMSAAATAAGGQLDWEGHVNAVVGVYQSLRAARSSGPTGPR